MYSDKLEKMIAMAIEDGVMEDEDYQVICKAATEEGIDIDELNLYVNSRLKKQKNIISNENNLHQPIDKECIEKENITGSPEEGENKSNNILGKAKEGAKDGLLGIIYIVLGYQHFSGGGIFSVIIWLICLPFILIWRALQLFFAFFI
ncbi:MAG: hypothetical protein IJK45_00310 [Bacteroidaceae bacterium]|nr:hypothetical protein [Bacteroidaceae bacterium]